MMRIVVLALAIAAFISPVHGQSRAPSEERVSAPPEAFFAIVDEKHREVARQFYKKYIDVNGMPVVASGEVADMALQRTYSIVTHMLAGRPDITAALVSNRMYLIIIGKDQVYTDMPEYRLHPNPAYQNERVRGTGGRPTSFGEENLLSLPIDRYDDESIGVHEFCHTIDGTLRSMDKAWRQRKEGVYQNALKKGLHRNTYAASNAGEYFAEICQAYFDCNRVNNWNHGPVGTREQLKLYDPEGYFLVREVFNLKPEQDWRYTFLQKLPNVGPPPARSKLDPYYTKFTWAREFTVVGKQASDAALLKANDTIRKMFAYRHDILKALMADGVKLVVLGPTETLSDLPEIRTLARKEDFHQAPDLLARNLDYHLQTKLLVVPQENVLANPRDPNAGDVQIIRAFAVALYHVTARRPLDPDWENRDRSVQQYELRVKRLDRRFGEALDETFDKALRADKWKGTAAIHDVISYWAKGVLAYFDAAGQDAVPPGASHPINTREGLKQYDPELFSLVEETMAYTGKVDWRY